MINDVGSVKRSWSTTRFMKNTVFYAMASLGCCLQFWTMIDMQEKEMLLLIPQGPQMLNFVENRCKEGSFYSRPALRTTELFCSVPSSLLFSLYFLCLLQRYNRSLQDISIPGKRLTDNKIFPSLDSFTWVYFDSRDCCLKLALLSWVFPF